MKYDNLVYEHARQLRAWPLSRKRQDYFIRLAFGAARVARHFEEYFDKEPEMLRNSILALISELRDE